MKLLPENLSFIAGGRRLIHSLAHVVTREPGRDRTMQNPTHLVRVFLAAISVLQFAASNASAQLPGSNIIPASRLIQWNPGTTVGVPGGIPTNRTQCMTAECTAVTNASVNLRTDLASAVPLLQAAINSAPANTYILVPSGTWLIDSQLSVPQGKNSITLRGSGVGATIFDCRPSTCIFVGTASDYNWSWPPTGNLVTSYAIDAGTGGTKLTIADTSAFTVGQLVKFTVTNDSSVPVISVAGYDRTRGQMTRVVAKTSSSLTVFPPIYGFDRFNSVAGKINVAQLQVNYVGIEDMTVDGSNGSVTFAIWFEQAYASWIKNVTVTHSSNYQVFFNDSLNCELRHSRLDTLNHGGTNGAGLLMNNASACLIEDNIIREAFPDIEINFGSAGNVVAYNFISNSNGSIGIDSNHAPHNSFNLFEGNVAHNLMSDGYFGGNSEDTIFRNLLHGNGVVASDTLTYCLSLKRFTRNVSLVGNILGSIKHTSGRCDSYGQPNIGNGSSTGTAQPSIGSYWAGWRPDTGTTIRGTLTGLTDQSHGTITLSSGTLTTGQAPALWLTGGVAPLTSVMVGTVSGNTVAVDSSPWGTVLPALNTGLTIWAGAGGFQELDLDVEATTLKKGNNFVPTGIPTSEALTTTLPQSLYRTAKPAWFGTLVWPPFDPAAPNVSYDAIPAGYRYVHGVDPPGLSGPQAPTGLKIISQ